VSETVRVTGFPAVTLDEFTVMPNHVHFIVVIDDRATRASPLQRIRAYIIDNPATNVRATHASP
jgi:hypothetical protein